MLSTHLKNMIHYAVNDQNKHNSEESVFLNEVNHIQTSVLFIPKDCDSSE